MIDDQCRGPCLLCCHCPGDAGAPLRRTTANDGVGRPREAGLCWTGSREAMSADPSSGLIYLGGFFWGWVVLLRFVGRGLAWAGEERLFLI